MASSMIHIAVASEINKVLKRDSKKLLIGSIAPFISKQIGETKVLSHFQDFDDDVPLLDNIIEEIPMDRINVIIDYAGILIKNSKESKAYVFDIDIISRLIKTSTSFILSNLKDLCVI